MAEAKGEVYAELLRVAIRDGAQPYLILRSLAEIRGGQSEGIQPPKELEISRDVVTGWPGTTLYGGDTATIVRMSGDRRFVDWALSVTKGLYDWVAPNRLEDLGFLRPDGSVWLASISHERDAFMDLSDQEYRFLLEECATLDGLLEQEPPDDGAPDSGRNP